MIELVFDFFFRESYKELSRSNRNNFRILEKKPLS